MDTIVPYYYLSEKLYFNTTHHPTIQDTEMTITCNFDYYNRFDGTWRIFFDTGFVYKEAEMLFRNGIEFPDETLTWDRLFNQELITRLINNSVEIALEYFKDKCDRNNIEIPGNLSINEATITNFVNETLHKYNTYRKKDDEANEKLMRNSIEIGKNDTVLMLINTPFFILNEVLLTNPSFNCKHNREAIEEKIPFPKYLTLYLACKEINDEELIGLNFLEMVYYLICLDCALQLLVGDKSDILIARLAENGMDETQSKQFLSSGGQFFKSFRDQLANQNIVFNDLYNLADWNKLIY